jgi:thymidylate synthase
MTAFAFVGDSLDDLLRLAIEAIRSHGDRIVASKGSNTELRGVLLELTNPLARISRTETRGLPFSALGEFCWYLAKTNDLAFIRYYIREYVKFADGDAIFGGYGPRLFNLRGINQIQSITELLTRKPTTRQAVVQLFNAEDILEDHKDLPCTCTLQFMMRNESLELITHMRSNDAYWGLPHDVFCFTMLQEIVARSLSVPVGTYRHIAGSLHLYDRHDDGADQFLAEGWQTTKRAMPPMPLGDPAAAIQSLLDAEVRLRTGGQVEESYMQALDSYWRDLVRLLQIYRAVKDKDPSRIQELREQMSTDVYDTFIGRKLTSIPNGRTSPTNGGTSPAHNNNA